MQKEQRASVQSLRAILIAAIAIPLALFVYACWLDYQTVTDVADKQIDRTADVVNEHALKVLEAVDRAIAEVDEIVRDLPDDAIETQEAELHSRLHRIVEATSQIKSLWVFDRSGRSLVNSINYPTDDTSFADRDYFAAHVAKDIGVYVGNVLRPRSPYLGAPFFGVSRRRSSPDGEFVGVIQASVLPDYFEGFYGKLAREPGAYASLVRENGVLLARYPVLEREAKLAEQGPLYRAMLAHPAEGKVTLVSAIDGQGRTVAYRKLSAFPVFILAGLSTDAVRDQWLAQVTRKLLFGVPATAALLAIVALALRRTRRLYAEADARQAAEGALKQAQRLEALGQLTGGVAHDFNNLLMVIAGSADRLKRFGSDPQIGRSLALIEAATQKGTSLTRQLLSFSRRQNLSPKVIDLAACIRNFSDVLRQSLRGDIRMALSIPDETVAVRVDRNEFEMALLNLVLNARDAMPDGGDVNIGLHTQPSRGQEHGLVCVTVADTGIGIPEEIREHLFEPYFTTKRLGKGTGLGLSQVYGFARQSGGDIAFASESGRGTTFTLSLPTTDGAIEDEPDRENNPLVPIALRVLLVEDNADVATVAADYLEQCGCTATQVRSAEDAMLALNSGKTFDLVFSDIVMPGASGLELARWVREHHPRLRVLLASGYSEQAGAAVAQGFTLLAKPYSIEALRSALASSQARPDAA